MSAINPRHIVEDDVRNFDRSIKSVRVLKAELDGVFSPHGKYEDTGHDDITMLKPGVWDSTRYVIANKSEQLETVDFSKMQEELEKARDRGDHAKVKTIEAAIAEVNRKSFREHQIEKQKEEEKRLKDERRRHGCCYCCVVALRCEPCLGQKKNKVSVDEENIGGACSSPRAFYEKLRLPNSMGSFVVKQKIKKSCANLLATNLPKAFPVFALLILYGENFSRLDFFLVVSLSCPRKIFDGS